MSQLVFQRCRPSLREIATCNGEVQTQGKIGNPWMIEPQSKRSGPFALMSARSRVGGDGDLELVQSGRRPDSGDGSQRGTDKRRVGDHFAECDLR